MASSLLVVSLTGQYFSYAPSENAEESHHHHHGAAESEEPSLLNRAGASIDRCLGIVVAPAARLYPLGLLSDGILVSWSFSAKAVGLLAVVYPGCFWFLASWALSRRELALPSQ